MPKISSPSVHGVSSLSATLISHNGHHWLEITGYGPNDDLVRLPIHFTDTPTSAAYIAAVAAAITAVPLVTPAPAEMEAA